MEWMIQVNDELENMADIYTSTEMERWQKSSIYKVPARVTDLNTKAYIPQAVSFGPYHLGKKHLNQMEEHKHRAFLHFLKRCRKPLELFINALAQVVQELKDSYEPLDPVWKYDTPRFLQLMILDGCFMLEILRTSTSVLDDYAPTDPIFSNHGKLYLMPYVKRDMLMLENQLPMLVLDRLVHVENNEAKDKEFVNNLILQFCSLSPNTCISKMGKCLHVLDMHRKSLLRENPRQKSRQRKSAGVNHAIGGDEII